MSMQRYRSDSSSTIDSPLSPTYLPHVSQSYPLTTNDKSSTANINVVQNNTNTRRGGPINISAPSLISPPSSIPRSSYDPPPTPTSPRLPQSPITSAAGVMKKLLRRRRGHTSDETGLGIVGPANSSNAPQGNVSYDSGTIVGLPGSLGTVHSFVIVGGQGAVAAGTTVYDLEPHSPVSPTMANIISPPSSVSSFSSVSFSPTTRASSGSMGPLVGTTGMISPRSPTFPQSMITRFSAGRDHQQQHQNRPHSQMYQQTHMHNQQQSIPAGYGTSPSLSSTTNSPIPIPVRGRSRQTSIPNTNMANPTVSTSSVSVIGPPVQAQSLSLTAAHLHRRQDRRSLSADGLRSEREQSSLSPSIHPIASDQGETPSQLNASDDQQQKQLSASLQSSLSSERHGQFQGDVEFFKNSVEFLQTHHSRHNTADDWANRNKRKGQQPVRRQSESCLLDKASENHDGHNDKVELSSSAPGKTKVDEWKTEKPKAFELDSHWRDIDPACQSMMDYDHDHLADDGDRSLLSSVDILLMPIISSPTRYYDCPRSRKLVKTYLTSKGREFDEMIEFGFPLSTVVDDNKSFSSSSSSSKDYRFLTLRLTLTPWHARADESKLYGSDDASMANAVVTASGAPIKEMVNKFLSRTSAKLSCSPPRILSLLPDARSAFSAGPDRKLSLTPDMTLSGTHKQLLSTDNEEMSPVESVVKPLSRPLTPRGCIDTPTSTTILPSTVALLPPSGPKGIKTCINNGVATVLATSHSPRRDKGFRIVESPVMPSPIPLPLPTISPVPLLRTLHSADYLAVDPTSSGMVSSPPSTPSPTTAYPYHTLHSRSQQHILPPRKGSLSVLSTFNIQQQQTVHSTGSFDDLTSQLSPPPAVPARRKASSPAIFNAAPTTVVNSNITHGPRYQHFAPTPPPDMTFPSSRSKSSPAFVTTACMNDRSNKISTSYSSSSDTMPTTATTAAPIPIPGANSRYLHQRPPVYGTACSSSPNTAVVASGATSWSETDIFGVPSARVNRPHRHDTSEHHNQSQQQLGLSSSILAGNPSSASDARRMHIPRTQYAPPVHSH
ncbi:hypothetical protein FBU30_007904 [Linnemannia zychae]|nr:hypothetical protein FBU30_007904 [Linnemannia zychae]